MSQAPKAHLLLLPDSSAASRRVSSVAARPSSPAVQQSQRLPAHAWPRPIPASPQESLGFLNTVMPRRVIQRMLSTGLAPRAAPAAVAAAGQRAQRVPAVEPAVVAPEAEPSNPSPRSPAFVADAAAGEAAAPPLLQLSVPEAAAARPACGGSAGGEGREGGDLYLATPTAASSEGGIEAYAATPSNEALPPSAAICGSGSIRHVAPGEAEPAVGVPGCAGSGALPDLAACGSDCSVGGGSAEPAGGSLSLGAAPKPAACSSGSSCKEGLDRGGVRGELELAGPPGSANAFLEIKTLRQKVRWGCRQRLAGGRAAPLPGLQGAIAACCA